MYIYFIVLVILCMLILTLSLKKYGKTNENVFLVISFVILSLIAALRHYSVGADTEQFVQAFDYIKNIEISDFSKLRYETGFSLLCWILARLKFSGQSLIIVSSLFINYSVMNFIKKNSKNVYMSTLLYILCTFYFSYMNIMRQAIAIGIILLGFENLKNKKNLRFSLYVIAASFFHFSALLCLLFIPMNKMKYNKKIIYSSIVFMIISFIFGNQIFQFLCRFSAKLAGYIGGQYDVENYFGALIKATIALLSYFFGIYLIGKPRDNEKLKNDQLLNFSFFALGISCIFSILVMKVNIFNRFYPYFYIFLIIWLPNCISTIKNSKSRLMLNLIILLLYGLYCFTVLFFRPEWMGVSNYNFFWNM